LGGLHQKGGRRGAENHGSLDVEKFKKKKNLCPSSETRETPLTKPHAKAHGT